MEDLDTKVERYKIAVEQVRHEANLSWHNFRTYLIVHAILVAFLLRSAFSQEATGLNLGICITSLIGLFLCLPWRATSLRNSAYHSFRMAQARELEPDGWNFLRGKGQEFAEGNKVKVDGNDYQVSRLGRILRRPKAARCIVYAFMIVYILIIILIFANNFPLIFQYSLLEIKVTDKAWLIKVSSIVIALAGTFFLASGLKIRHEISKDLSKELELEKKNLLAPSEIVQRTGRISAGLIMITISGLLQLLIVLCI